MLSENKKLIEMFYVMSFAIFAVGSAVGALYFKYNFEGNDSVSAYMKQYALSLRSGMDFKMLVNTSIKNYLALFAIITFSSFFKFGPLFSCLALLRKSFVSAFTASAIFDVYSWNAVFLLSALLPQILIIFPLAALLNSVCITYLTKHTLLERKDKTIYIIFLIIIITIFCASAVCEGFLTTTFMKWGANKVT